MEATQGSAFEEQYEDGTPHGAELVQPVRDVSNDSLDFPGLHFPTMQLRLTAPIIDFWVDVRLRSWHDRWLAVADIAGEPEIGLGRSARQALERALAGLGPRTAKAFLADPALLGASADGEQERDP